MRFQLQQRDQSISGERQGKDNCVNEWHGVDMRDTNKVLGR